MLSNTCIKAELRETDSEAVVTSGCVARRNGGKTGQRYKYPVMRFNKFWGANVQHGDYS